MLPNQYLIDWPDDLIVLYCIFICSTKWLQNHTYTTYTHSKEQNTLEVNNIKIITCTSYIK